MSQMSKIDQIHLRTVMLCISKMSKMGKEHTHIFAHNFLNIQPIFNLQKFWKAETLSISTIPSNTVYIKAC